jgi:hypothetical protein
MRDHRDTNDRYAYDHQADEFVKETFSRPPAHDVNASGARTKDTGTHDEIFHADAHLRVMRQVAEELAAVPEREERISWLTDRVGELDEEVPVARENLALARGQLRSIEYWAPVESRPHRFPLEGVLIAVLATVEAALSYVGFRLAAPQVSAPGSEPLLNFLSHHGPEAAALGVGVMFACAQMLIGRELARSGRGVLTNPE